MTGNNSKVTPPPFNYSDTNAAKAGHKFELPDGAALHACMGLNECAGQDRYGLSGPDGDNPNSCAGQGYCATTANHSCHTNNDCAGQGGCGLYGWGPDLAVPGQNDCKSMGSCATPINAERFVTDGPDRGTSVWVLARQAFKEAYDKKQKESGSETPPVGNVPEPFTDTGPTYAWVSATGCMSACGSSGLSGAGSCS
ncbi:MAG: hypothetical protein AAF478_09125 [Pseudomonadota bacterium]